MLKLIIEDDEGRKTVVPFVRDEITIGRQEGNTIRLTERNVSRRHARLMRSNGHVLVEDLGSYNGIRINGDRIAGQVQVNEGDLIQIGDYDLAVQREGEMAAAAHPNNAATQELAPIRMNGNAPPRGNTADNDKTMPALPLVDGPGQTLGADEEPEEANPDDVSSAPTPILDDAAARRQSTAIIRMDQVEASRPRQVVEIDATEAPRLVVLNTQYAGKEFSCVRSELRIGRTDDNDIALDHASLSRTHCKVVREDTGEWRIIDMQSANGLMVNGEPYAQAPLRHGDVIELGHLKLKFVGSGESYTYKPGDGVRRSRGPVFAAIAVVLVGIIGGGYWFMFKRAPTKVVDPDEQPIGLKPSTHEPVEPTPEEQNDHVEKLLAEATRQIEAGNWEEAKKVLATCFVGSSPCPQATALTKDLDHELGLKDLVNEAEALLNKGLLPEAGAKLDEADHSKFLGKRIAELKDRQRKAVAERVNNGGNVAAAVVKPVPPPVPVEPPKPPPGDAQLAIASEAYKAKDYKAAKSALEDCLKVAPQQFECHKLLGATYAQLQDGVSGLKHYEAFVQYAPPGHPSIPKVKELIAKYKASQGGR